MKSQAINQLINFSWTIICFIPVFYFWIGRDTTILYSLVLFSLVFALLPGKLFDHFQISDSTRFYERLGVRFIQNFVQNGTYINRAIRKNDQKHKVVRDRGQAQKYLSTISMYERYHSMCFVFFVLTFVYGLLQHRYISAVVIFVANIIYNVCPILLQQYNKLRVKRLLKIRGGN